MKSIIETIDKCVEGYIVCYHSECKLATHHMAEAILALCIDCLAKDEISEQDKSYIIFYARLIRIIKTSPNPGTVFEDFFNHININENTHEI